MPVWGMLTVVFAATSVVAIVAAVRGRSTKFVGVLAGLLTAGCGWVWWSQVRLEHRLSEAVSGVAGVTVHVDCQEPFFGELLATEPGGRVDARDDGSMDDVAHLGRGICAAASSWPEADTDDAYIAVHVLTHEAGHVRGERNEAATECWAMHHSVEVAEALGASRAQAERRSRWYRRAVYPRLASSYTDGGCDAGSS